MKTRSFRWYDLLMITMLVILASFYNFYATNLFWSDVANYAQKLNWPYILTTIPYIIVSIMFVMFVIFLVRYIKFEEKYRTNHTKKYARAFLILSVIGFAFTIVTGAYVYHDFLAPYPFRGSTIVMIVFYCITMFFNGFATYVTCKRGKDAERVPYRKGHVLYSIGVAIWVYVAFNRFGAFLWMGSYIDINFMGYTIAFIISLLLPIISLLTVTNMRLGLFGKNPMKGVIITNSIILVVGIACCLTTAILGINEPMTVALISCAMPLERLATVPIDFILIVLSSLLPPIFSIIYVVTKLEKEKKV